MTIQELRSQITSASNILLILPYLIDYDAVATASLLVKLIQRGSDKRVSIASSQSLLQEYLEILKKVDIDSNKVLKSIEPISYVISVADIQDKVNVSWNRNNNDLDLVLIPEKGEVDFSKVNFSRQGGTYDLVIVINAAKLPHLGQIYERNRGLFESYNLISIGKSLETESGNKKSILPLDYSSTSELIFDNYSELGGEVDEVIAEITAYGLIGRTDGLQRTKSTKTFQILSDLAGKYNIDISKLFQEFNSKLAKSDLNLEERIIRNLKVDDSRKTIYSSLSLADFNALNFKPENFDASKFIPKNIKGNYNYAFLAYEKGINHTIVLIQSLNPENNLQLVASELNAYPNTSYAQAEFMVNAEKSISQTLKAIGGEELEEISSPASTQQVEQPITDNKIEAVQPEDTVENKNTEVIDVTPVENTNTEEKVETTTQSPFVRASEMVVDSNAKPSKESNYFSSTDKPFNRAQ